MRSMLLSVALGLSALGFLPGGESVAQAQSRRGGSSAGVQFSSPRSSTRGSAYYGPSRYSYPSRNYYYDRYYYSTPRYDSYYGSQWSYSYAPSRYHYYWSGGYYVCLDRYTGAYWYQQAGWWYRWH